MSNFETKGAAEAITLLQYGAVLVGSCLAFFLLLKTGKAVADMRWFSATLSFASAITIAIFIALTLT